MPLFIELQLGPLRLAVPADGLRAVQSGRAEGAIDLREVLKLDGEAPAEPVSILLQDAARAALLVDAVVSTIDLAADCFTPLPPGLGPAGDYFDALATIAADERILYRVSL